MSLGILMQITNSHTRMTEKHYVCKIIRVQKFPSLKKIAVEGPEFLPSEEELSSQQLIGPLVFRPDFTTTLPPFPSGFSMTVERLKSSKILNYLVL